MIVLLCSIAFIIFVLFKLFGFHLYWILSLLALGYLMWGKDKVSISPKRTSVKQFMASDKELMTLLAKVDSEVVLEVTAFFKLYLEVFTKGTDKFDILLDKRREILNLLSSSVITGKEVPDDVIVGLSDCMWKYVKIVITKYDLPYSYPIPHNTIDPRDLH